MREDEAPMVEAVCQGRDARRPADVWLPLGGGHSKRSPEAWDLAVTSGMRNGVVPQAVCNPELITAEYAKCKVAFQDTGARCAAEGLTFTPVVFEAHGGGFGAGTRRVLDFVAAQQVAAGQWCPEGVSMRVAQRISTALHGANALAILRRMPWGQGGPGEVSLLGNDDEGDEDWEVRSEGAGGGDDDMGRGGRA
jgi:hypothetical protein